MVGKLRNMTSLYLKHKDKMLLLYRIGSDVIEDSYIGAAGGHFEEEELNNPKACVLRELQEEMGLTEKDIANLTLRYVTLRVKNGEVRQNYYFFADLVNFDLNLKSNEGNLEWFSKEEVLKLPMPYTAKYVVKHYLEVGQYNEVLYAGIPNAEGVLFTELKDF